MYLNRKKIKKIVGNWNIKNHSGFSYCDMNKLRQRSSCIFIHISRSLDIFSILSLVSLGLKKIYTEHRNMTPSSIASRNSVLELGTRSTTKLFQSFRIWTKTFLLLVYVNLRWVLLVQREIQGTYIYSQRMRRILSCNPSIPKGFHFEYPRSLVLFLNLWYWCCVQVRKSVQTTLDKSMDSV